MNATETKLLAKADKMSESMLVSLGDWELAHLRMAMLNGVEDAVNDSLQDSDFISRGQTESRIPRGGDTGSARGLTETESETHR